MNIVRDDNDRWRFLTCLRFYNDKSAAQYLMRSYFINLNLVRSNLTRPGIFDWPTNEENQEPIVSIVAYCLMDNHYHLLMREIIPGGISEFMRKLGTGYTMYLNNKYGEVGKIFQGSYHARVVDSINYLQYIDAYIQALNPFERITANKSPKPAKIDLAQIIDDQFSSLGESLGYRNFQILNRKEAESKFNLPNNQQKYEQLLESVVMNGGFAKIIGKLAIDLK